MSRDVIHVASGGGYDDVDRESLRVTISPIPPSDGEPGLVLSTTSLTIPESPDGRQTRSYTVRLNSRPTGNVTVDIGTLGTFIGGSGDENLVFVRKQPPPPNDLIINGSSYEPLTFTQENWYIPQTLYAQGPLRSTTIVADRTDNIQHRASGANYGNVTQDLEVTIPNTAIALVGLIRGDDDGDGTEDGNRQDLLTIDLEPIDLDLSYTVDEGSTVTYIVGLASAPRLNVTVTHDSSNPMLAMVTPPSLVLSNGGPSNPDFRNQQVFTVRIPDDDVDHGSDRTVVIRHSVTSIDTNYNNLPGESIGSLTLTVRDVGDTAGVTLTPVMPSTITEGGEDATYTIVLDTEPTGNVTIAPESSNPAVARILSPLVFTPTNWQTPQTVTVRSLDDNDDINDPETVTISHRVIGGGYDRFTATIQEVDRPTDADLQPHRH